MLRLYTDESPGLKVDPVVVLVLSLVFIFSVVALHSEPPSFFYFSLFLLGIVVAVVRCFWGCLRGYWLMGLVFSYRQDYSSVLELDGLMRKGLGEGEERLRAGRGYDTGRLDHAARLGDIRLADAGPTPEVLFVLFGVLGGCARYLGKTDWGCNKT